MTMVNLKVGDEITFFRHPESVKHIKTKITVIDYVKCYVYYDNGKYDHFDVLTQNDFLYLLTVNGQDVTDCQIVIEESMVEPITPEKKVEEMDNQNREVYLHRNYITLKDSNDHVIDLQHAIDNYDLCIFDSYISVDRENKKIIISSKKGN